MKPKEEVIFYSIISFSIFVMLITYLIVLDKIFTLGSGMEEMTNVMLYTFTAQTILLVVFIPAIFVSFVAALSTLTKAYKKLK